MAENTNNTTKISTNELQARLQKAENIRARDGCACAFGGTCDGVTLVGEIDVWAYL